MRKRIVQEVPDTLPPSAIFLDDLGTFENLVRDSMSDGYELTGFLYEFDRSIVVDSIEELKSNRGHAKKFRMLATHKRALPSGEEMAGSSRIFELDDLCRATITCPVCLKIGEHHFCREIKKTFEARKNHLRATIESLSPGLRDWFGPAIPSVAFSGLLISSFFCGKFVYSLHLSRASNALVTFLFFASFILVMIGAVKAAWLLSLSRGLYRVNFHFERERQLEREEARKGAIGKILLILLSAAIGVVGTLFVQWLGSAAKR